MASKRPKVKPRNNAEPPPPDTRPLGVRRNRTQPLQLIMPLPNSTLQESNSTPRTVRPNSLRIRQGITVKPLSELRFSYGDAKNSVQFEFTPLAGNVDKFLINKVQHAKTSVEELKEYVNAMLDGNSPEAQKNLLLNQIKHRYLREMLNSETLEKQIMAVLEDMDAWLLWCMTQSEEYFKAKVCAVISDFFSQPHGLPENDQLQQPWGQLTRSLGEYELEERPLKDQLYWHISKIFPMHAKLITRKLMELGPMEIRSMLYSEESLKVKARLTAIGLLTADAKEQERLLNEQILPTIHELPYDLSTLIIPMLERIEKQELMVLLRTEEPLSVIAAKALADSAKTGSRRHYDPSRTPEVIETLAATLKNQTEPEENIMCQEDAQEEPMISWEQLFPRVYKVYPEFAEEITKNILELHKIDNVDILEDDQRFRSKVYEVFSKIKACEDIIEGNISPGAGDPDGTPTEASAPRRESVLVGAYQPASVAAASENPKEELGRQLLSRLQELYSFNQAAYITGKLLTGEIEDIVFLLYGDQALKHMAAKVLGESVTKSSRRQYDPSQTPNEYMQLRCTPVEDPQENQQEKVEERRIAWERLFPRVYQICPELAKEITGSLLDFNRSVDLNILQDDQYLKAKVSEAIEKIRASEAAEERSQSACARQPYSILPKKGSATQQEGSKNLKECTEVRVEPSKQALGQRARNEKDIMGDQIYSIVYNHYPHEAVEITKILLQNDNRLVRDLLQNEIVLKAKVLEALAIIRTNSRQHQPPVSYPPDLLLSHSYHSKEPDVSLRYHDHQPVNASPLTGHHQPTVSCPPGVYPDFPSHQNYVGPEQLTASTLAAASLLEQKRMLGNHLYQVIHRKYPDLAGKITGMLLEFDNFELLTLLQNELSLNAKVEEAVAVLKKSCWECSK